MVRKCIYCRKRVITNSGRTFHQFPKNEKVRQKWLDALNLPKEPNFKTATVCSDHFQEEDFFFPNNMTLRRKLRSHAVPNVLFCNRGESDGISFEEIKITSDGRILSDDEEEEDTKDFIKTENIFCFDGIQLENGDFQSIKEEPQEEEEDTNLLVDNNIVDSISSDEKNSTERQQSPFRNDGKIKKIRFIHAFRTEYISREDFASDESWEKFMRFYTHQKLRNSAAYSRDFRKRRKLEFLKNTVKFLKGKQKLNASGNLKESSSEDEVEEELK
ncbi:uncharacterized protein LOC122498132 isoform X2 [Leptopilina heterotoma]|uniref:uncharacterized protein LOC122498132 isoform X2 n=1 Tax=Leptopilina heterotoma TaxID=63436 RepID=UPI001CA7F7F6|nr:uncharacterized protein LOC122498132 isoform X2 [Leptopilina heterotoma]